MLFITKRRMRQKLLQIMNDANALHKSVESNPEATEQEKRDAFMFVSGSVYCVMNALKSLRGEDDE